MVIKLYVTPYHVDIYIKHVMQEILNRDYYIDNFFTLNEINSSIYHSLLTIKAS